MGVESYALWPAWIYQAGVADALIELWLIGVLGGALVYGAWRLWKGDDHEA
jgi:hypothetical protein